MPLDKNQIRELRKAYLAHNREVLEENRAATIEERWRNISVVEEMWESLGKERQSRDDSAVRERWLKAKRRLHG
ncbi:MAG: hypothetical protein HZC36_03225 [Armatimonadetes bacterium]|nr:hypothetical protein [Armatimonadota bacterium]